ncbi:lysM domain-containing protein [Apiospora sp. TS-2023a]
MGLCDSPTQGQYVCASAPGTNSSYALPPPPLGTSADAGNQQRGGEGGVVAPTTTVSSTITDPASQGSGSAPSPTQDGLASNCNNFASVKGGDTCFDWAKVHGITPEQLYAWNPVLGLNGADCSTKFWSSEYYCIGVRPTQTTPVTAPGPTQSGIAPNCNKYAQAQKGDVCDTFAARNSISNAQLYAWNAALGSSGQNCGSSLWADEWYCVGISAPATGSTTSSSKTTRVTAPGPTQTGIAANCTKYAEALSGEACGSFASRNGITTTQLYSWNTVLGPKGENCQTSFWAQEYYCVGVS